MHWSHRHRCSHHVHMSDCWRPPISIQRKTINNFVQMSELNLTGSIIICSQNSSFSGQRRCVPSAPSIAFELHHNFHARHPTMLTVPVLVFRTWVEQSSQATDMEATRTATAQQNGIEVAIRSSLAYLTGRIHKFCIYAPTRRLLRR